MVENNGKIKTQIPITDKDSQEIVVDIVMEGKSAYDMAVEKGFDGTLEEWLLSLHGKDGKDADVDGIQAQFDTVEERLDSTDAQLNNMKQDFTQHELDYEEHKGDYNTLESEFTQHKLDYVNLNDRVDNIITTPAEGVSVQEIVDARQGELSLGANLTGVKSQLAHTESSKVDKAGSGQVKWANIAQDARQQISGDKVAVVEDDSIVTSNLTNNVVNTSKLKEGAVTPRVTSFVKTSTNIVDINNVLKGKVVSSSGVLTDHGSYNTSEPLDVLPNQKLFVKHIHYLSFYDQESNFISRKEILSIEGGFDGAFIETPANAYYVRASIKTNISGIQPQLNISDVALPYEPYFLTMEGIDIDQVNILGRLPASKISTGAITPEKTSFINVSTNLFNRRTIVRGEYYHSSGEIDDTRPEYYRSEFIKVAENKEYTISSVFRVSFFDGDKKFIRYIDNSNLREPMTFEAIEGALYVVLNFNKAYGDAEDIHMNLGSELLPYEPFRLTFEDLIIHENQIITDMGDERRKFSFSPEEIVGDFVADKKTYNFLTLEDIYNGYYNLQSQYPDYITVENIGKDSSGEYDMLEVRLTPEQLPSPKLEYPLPKIMITPSIHGHEPLAAHSMYRLVELMCNDWQNDSRLEYLRHNVEFAIVPIANPYGYVHNSGSNVNGVDLQRNGSVGWTNEDESYGSEPLSEIESVILQNFFDRHNDSMLFIDYHTHGGLTNPFWWIIPSNSPYVQELKSASKFHIENINRLFIKEYESYPDDLLSGAALYVRGANQGTLDSYTIQELNMPSVVVEGFNRFIPDGESRSSDTHKANLEHFTNFLLMNLRVFKKINS